MPYNVFVISTGRTGTKFLAETIRELGARAAHEPGPRWLRLVSNAYVAGALPHERAVSLFSKVRGPSNTWDVEASCLIYGLTRPILDAKPDARVVHLIRDPRTYVRSAMNWGVHRPGGRPLNVIPYRRLTLPQMTGRSPRLMLAWTRRDQFSRVCWTWRTQNEAMAQQGEGDDRFVTIRMEDLFDREHSGFLKILEFAGLPAPDPDRLEALLKERINPAPKRKFPGWEDWTTEQLEELLTQCGDLAESYGYPVKGEVGALLKERSSA